MTLTNPPAEVAIIGGGLAGCTLALALHRHRITSTVYEARSETHNPGGGLMLSPNALRALDSLGAYRRLFHKALQFDKLYFKNDKDETTDIYPFGSEAVYGYQAMRIMRKELLEELFTMLRERNIPVKFNSTLATVDDDSSEASAKVQFTFTDGHQASAPLLIGADGIHSKVRSSIFPEAQCPTYAGILGISCIVQRSHLRIPEGYGLPAIAMGKPGAFLLVPQNPDGSELYVGAQRLFPESTDWDSLRKDKQKPYDMIHERQSDWPDIVQSALEAMPVDRMGLWAFHGLPPLSSWISETKRIILVGDAAHAIPPTVGQGANQAIEDVCALASLLSKLSPEVRLDKAIALWQSYRQERIQKILDLTQQMNAKRLPEADKTKLSPSAIWTQSSSTSGEDGELHWLYDVDMSEEAERWAEELRLQASLRRPS